MLYKNRYKIQYFCKPYEPFGGDINVKVDLSTKRDLKNATGIDSYQLDAKSDLVSLKADVDKLVIDKLKGFPVDLSKLNNAVNDEVVNLAAKVNNIKTSRFCFKN